MQKKWADKGLVIIMLHSQNVEKPVVMAFLRSHGLNFSVYGSGQVKGVDSSGIPHVVVFDWKGEIKFEGTYLGLDKTVDELMKSAPDWLAGPREYVKVKAEAEKVRKRKTVGQASKALRQKAESADAEEKGEATELLARLDAHAKRQEARAEALAASGNPLAALNVLKDLAADFKGDEIGDRAAAAEKQKSADPVFKKEIEAGKALAKIEAMIANLGAPNPGQSPDQWRKKNAGPLGAIVAAYKALEKKYPDTKVCQRAKDIVEGMNAD